MASASGLRFDGPLFYAILFNSTVQIIRELLIREEARGPFELTFGSGSAWSSSFARSDCFQGIILLRDIQNPQRYRMVESWNKEAHREQALAKRREEFARLETTPIEGTESGTGLGTFRMRAEAAVRPLR